MVLDYYASRISSHDPLPLRMHEHSEDDCGRLDYFLECGVNLGLHGTEVNYEAELLNTCYTHEKSIPLCCT